MYTYVCDVRMCVLYAVYDFYLYSVAKCCRGRVDHEWFYQHIQSRPQRKGQYSLRDNIYIVLLCARVPEVWYAPKALYWISKIICVLINNCAKYMVVCYTRNAHINKSSMKIKLIFLPTT